MSELSSLFRAEALASRGRRGLAARTDGWPPPRWTTWCYRCLLGLTPVAFGTAALVRVGDAPLLLILLPWLGAAWARFHH